MNPFETSLWSLGGIRSRNCRGKVIYDWDTMPVTNRRISFRKRLAMSTMRRQTFLQGPQGAFVERGKPEAVKMSDQLYYRYNEEGAFYQMSSDTVATILHCTGKECRWMARQFQEKLLKTPPNVIIEQALSPLLLLFTFECFS